MILGDLAEVRMGYSFRSRLEHDPNGDLAVVQMKDIDDSNLLNLEQVVRVRLPDVKPSHLLHTGDLLCRSRGRSNGVALVGRDVQAAVLAAPMLLIRPHAVLPDYLHWFINLPVTQAMLAQQAAGTSVQMISKEAIQRLEILVPDLARQRQVVKIADLARQEERLVSAISQRRKQLIEARLLRLAGDFR